MKTMTLFFCLCTIVSVSMAQPFARSFPTPMPMDGNIKQDYLFGAVTTPITSENALTVKEGHFYTKAGKRVRLLGTTLYNAACFPDSALAVNIARRLAGLGCNAVRLAGIDNQWWRNYGSVFAEGNDTKSFDPQQMRKLDRLIVELQKNGIYVVMQLYSQWMPRAGDNIPAYDSIPWNGRYVNFFVPQVIDHIRNYAIKLYNHRNSITNIAYKDDPTIACIELTDDNALFGGWSNGLLHPGNNFSATHSNILDAVWNSYLFNKYKTTNALSKAWEITPNTKAIMPVNGNFEDKTDPLSRWELAVNTDNDAVANVYPSNGIKQQGSFSAWIKVNKPGKNVYDVIYVNRSISVQRFLQYEVRFWARTDAAAQYTAPFFVAIQRSNGSFENYGLLYQNDAPLTENWREYVTRFRANTTDSLSAMLSLYVGAGAGNIYIDDIRVTPVSEAGLVAGESLENRTIKRVRRIDESIAISPIRSADQALFYTALVDNYMTLMQKLLRDTIGTKALLTSGTTPVYINEVYSERNLDYSGSAQSTDYVRYTDNNQPDFIAQSGIVEDRFLGVLSSLTRNARVGKPHIISNYLMPNISARTGEMMTILPLFSAYQDWDGIFIANWGNDVTQMNSQRLDSNNVWTFPHNSSLWALTPSIRFALDNNIIQSAPRSITLKNTADNFVYPAEQLQYGYWLKQFPDTRMALFRRVRYDSLIASEASEAPHAQIQQLADGTLNTANIISETEELTWNIDIGTLTVNTPRLVAASGVLSGQLFSFGTTRFERTDGGNYGSMTWLSTDTSALHRSTRSLLTLSSRSGNTGMIWRNDSSAWGKAWGNSPVIAEAMTARLSFVSDADSVYAVPLDMEGNPMAMTIQATKLSGNRRSFIFDQSQTPALWFSVHQMWKTSGLHDGDFAPSMTVSPNPVTDHATLSLAFPALQSTANVSLISLTGEILPLWNGVADGSTVWIDISSASIPAGAYTVRAQTGTWHKEMNIIVY